MIADTRRFTMSLALTSQAVHHRLRTKQLYLQAQASGNYIPGGDVLNLQSITPKLGQGDATIGYPGSITDYFVASAPPGFSASLVKGATLSTWGLQVFETAAAEPDGVPLGLGTLSAAATTSTYTAAGLCTVFTTTPPPLGSFIVLSNGASGKGIFFDGVMVQVTAVVAGVSYSFNFGQGLALAYANAADTLKYQVVQASATNPLQAVAQAAPITGVLATANLLTITQANNLQVGQFVYLGGTFKTASLYASGAIVQVASATSTGWTANWQGTIIAQTSAEVATSAVLTTNGGAPIASYPYSAAPVAPITNSLAVAADATHAGLLTLTAAQVYQPGMLIVVQNVGTNASLDGTIATVITTGLTQAIIKANGWGAIANTSAETAGYAAVLVTGTPSSATGELPAAPYPAGALAAPFVIMVEGPKGKI
jgi:hypothetical protein